MFILYGSMPWTVDEFPSCYTFLHIKIKVIQKNVEEYFYGCTMVFTQSIGPIHAKEKRFPSAQVSDQCQVILDVSECTIVYGTK